MNRLNQLAINRDGFAFDPMVGESYTLNVTAREAVAEFAKGASVAQVAQRFASDYGITQGDAERDLADLVSRLKQFGLMQ